MSKYKPYSRRRFNRRFRAWGQKHLWRLVALALGAAGLIALVTAGIIAFVPHTPFMWWALGVVQVGVVAVYLNVVHLAFLAYDRDAIMQMRGAWGEDNTRSELLRARRRRHIWGWVDSIQLEGSDIDHLVVTRRGGLVTIDSKWRSQGSDIAAMARSAQLAGMRSKALARDALARGGRSDRALTKADPLTVTAVVVVWGAEQGNVPPGYHRDGVEFIAGRQLVKWLAAHETQAVTRAVARDLLSGLERYRASSWGANAHKGL